MSRYPIPIKGFQDYLEAWENLKGKAPFNIIDVEIRCKYCNSKNLSKYGIHKNTQLWWCKECKRKFANNSAYPRTRIPADAIHSALYLYYKGVPLKSIREQLEEEYDCYPSDSTVYRWIQRNSLKGEQDIKDHHPQVGSTWLINESILMIGSKRFWVLDLLDTCTHYLLASTLTSERSLEDMKTLIESARDKVQMVPEILITRRTPKYLKDIELALGVEFHHMRIQSLAKEEKIKFSKYWMIMLKRRRILMHNLRLDNMRQLILKGCTFYYNYYLAQRSLKGKTPSQAAKIEFRSITTQWIEEHKSES
jgi:transposase-like protein